MLGAAWRENLGWPDGAIAQTPDDDSVGGRSDPARAPADHRRAVLGRSASRSRRQQPGAPHRACSPAACAATNRPMRRGAPSGSATTSSTTAPRRPSSSTCRPTTSANARRWTVTAASSLPPRTTAVPTRLTAVDVPTADREPRRPVRRPGRSGVRRRHRRPRADPAAGAAEARPMKIGMVCYASVGGSGVVATELAHALARARAPRPPDQQRAAVPAGATASPACRSSRSWCRRIRSSASRNICSRWPTPSRGSPNDHRLDIVHAHYAVPHATAAYLADQMLASTPSVTAPAHRDDAARHRHHAGRQRSVVCRGWWPSRSSGRTP